MGTTAFIFPGQGAQYAGMGKDFYEQIPVSREVFDRASKVTGLDIPALCFTENPDLHVTKYTQIAMLTVEIAILRAVEGKGIHSSVNAGLSLGEYGALAASGVMREEDLFSVVMQRGIFMEEAVPTGGAMSAVLGADTDLIRKVCEETEGIVTIANYNCPGQIVISGEAEAVKAAGEKMKAAGVRRIVPLKVSGPFHSPMMESAGERLGKVLEKTKIREFSVPYLSNATGHCVTEAGQVKDLLIRQVSSSVRWQQCVEEMIRSGVDTFVEIGPGKTLTGFLRKIDRNVKALNVEKVEDLEKFCI